MGRFTHLTADDIGTDLHLRRGKSGGQVRDEYRDEFDAGRGGYGKAYAAQMQKAEEDYGSGR